MPAHTGRHRSGLEILVPVLLLIIDSAYTVSQKAICN